VAVLRLTADWRARSPFRRLAPNCLSHVVTSATLPTRGTLDEIKAATFS